MSILDRLSFQLYSARKFPPLDRAARDARRARFQERRALWRPARRCRGVEGGAAAPRAESALDARFAGSLNEPISTGFVRQARDLGVTLVIVPAIPPEQRPAGCGGLATASAVSLCGFRRRRLPGTEFALAWHNHDFEFRRLPDGSCPLDLMLRGGARCSSGRPISAGCTQPGEEPGATGSTKYAEPHRSAAHQGCGAGRREGRRGRLDGYRRRNHRLEEADAGASRRPRPSSSCWSTTIRPISRVRPPLARGDRVLVRRARTCRTSASALSAAATSPRSISPTCRARPA